MQLFLLWALIGGIVIICLAIIWVLSKISAVSLQIANVKESLEKDQSKLEQTVKDEICRNRDEMHMASKQARDELTTSIRSFEQAIFSHLSEVASHQKMQFDTFSQQITAFTQSNEQKLENIRQTVETKIQLLTEETRKELQTNGDNLSSRFIEGITVQQNQLNSFSAELKILMQSNEQKMELIRHEVETKLKTLTDETSKQWREMSNNLLARILEMGTSQQNQLDSFSNKIGFLTQSTEEKLEQMRATLEQRVKDLQNDNAQKLDRMRTVVDEKLHATLEQRLGESFKLVSERLELVHKGLGEMQTLASGVGDLKKVLTNVKTRGTWGEVQLGNILEDMLSPDQYATNVSVKKGTERVEFAIKLPGSSIDNECIWLPIDAKFPMGDYQKLVEAYDLGDASFIDQAARQLELKIRGQAKEISTKYIEPPETTDFAIMFLPTEGLYAEVLRRPGLFEGLRRDFRITVAGPTTLAAIINSLSMGFRTLAIQKRSSEVWSVLGAVKTEFGKFGAVLEKTQKKLQEASSTIDEATRRSRAMERKLRTVEALPENQTVSLLGDDSEIASGSDI